MKDSTTVLLTAGEAALLLRRSNLHQVGAPQPRSARCRVRNMKRHFSIGRSSRSARETYRIDDTSCDGSGLTPDDGAARAERGLPEVSRSDLRDVVSRNSIKGG